MSQVLLSIEQGIARIRLNRPEALNSLSPELLDELEKAVAEVRADTAARVAIFSGEGRAFCTGADLQSVLRLLEEWPDYIKFLYQLTRVFSAIEQLPVPTVAQVHGYALAGGLELVLACDMAIAGHGALIGDQHANFGLIAGAGGIPRLVRRVGKQAASEILYTGKWLSGQDAAACGIVLRAVPDEDLDSAVGELAAQLRPKARISLSYMKRVILAGLDVPLVSALNEERAALIEYFGTSKHPREGISAYLEKRDPNFDE